MRGRRRLDHRPLLHRLRAALQRGDQRDVPGRARPIRPRTWWRSSSATGDHLLHGADRDPHLHDTGGPTCWPARPHSLRLLGPVGEPINPKVWELYHKVVGGERCPVVDTWWQTETGQIMISPLPGITSTKPGSATRPLPGIEADVFDERRARLRGRRPAGPSPPLAGDAPDPLPRRRAIRRYVFLDLWTGDLSLRRRRPPRRGWLLWCWAGSTTRSTSPGTCSRPPRSSR